MPEVKGGQTWVTVTDPPHYVEVFTVDTEDSPSYKEGYELSVGYTFRRGIYYRSIDSFTKCYMLSSED
jgi:hypothetical protein